MRHEANSGKFAVQGAVRSKVNEDNRRSGEGRLTVDDARLEANVAEAEDGYFGIVQDRLANIAAGQGRRSW